MEYDTLYFANKKYIIERSNNTYKTSVFDSPFNIISCEYEQKYKPFYYSAIDECNCTENCSYDADGNTICSFECANPKKKNYQLYNVVDSIFIDFEDVKYPYIKIERKDRRIFNIDKIQFKLIYDTTSVYINWEVDQVYEKYFTKLLKETKNDNKLKFIIVNAMFYTDQRKTIYYLPTHFIIWTNENKH